MQLPKNISFLLFFGKNNFHLLLLLSFWVCFKINKRIKIYEYKVQKRSLISSFFKDFVFLSFELLLHSILSLLKGHLTAHYKAFRNPHASLIQLLSKNINWQYQHDLSPYLLLINTIITTAHLIICLNHHLTSSSLSYVMWISIEINHPAM